MIKAPEGPTHLCIRVEGHLDSTGRRSAASSDHETTENTVVGGLGDKRSEGRYQDRDLGSPHLRIGVDPTEGP